ncbi:hypothetical protein [Pseudomonas sp. RGM2987]|uniref:hypothetical protein n=1 Tax=Pseudomonas sp. RGM2987 TaxID=2930090 RepID=UPI001FD716F6|nr:hypothetical protein [Pseudomonas sp. RGM2987]MCJ8207274.1 hypothetical protein [Pseudomonas sp. RGM2987]
MLGVEVFKGAYQKLACRFAGLTSDVYLVPPSQMNERTDLLGAFKVEYDEKLYFNDDAADMENYGIEGAGGITINFLLAGKGRSAIFINENCLQEGEREDLIWLWRYNSLHHELMHALDFSKQKNFNTERRTMDLVGAEVFADYKTLLHLKSMSSNGFMKIALQSYASNAKVIGAKGGIRTEIYNRLVRKIGSNTIDHWATMKI